VANINGNNSANNLFGTASDDVINARGGNDVVDAGDGNDIVDGGDGHDILFGGRGNDRLIGGTGNDTLNGGLGSDVLDGGAGVDTLSYAGAQSHNVINLTTGVATQQWLGQSVGVDSLSNFENVVGGDHIDTIRGNSGNNVIHGGGSSDVLQASLGRDHLDGDAGDNDTVEFSGVGPVTASLATGTYSINATSYGTLANIDHLTGGTSADTLTGDGARNYLNGGAGNDQLAGGLGNDELWGGAGADRLVADGGNDFLSGNYDRLGGFGDSAADIFEIRTNAGAVTISDFQIGIDKIDLTAFGFDQSGVSPYWTGSVTADNSCTVLTLTGLNNEVVSIALQGVAEGDGMTMSDLIGGSPSLIHQPLYPINGGDGLRTVTQLTPSSGSQTITGFENGLDQLDISALIQAGWDGSLSTSQQGWAVVDFFNGQGQQFSITLEGVSIAQIDPSDYIV
jgi:Ca2+-binding RTX toxin-like protein